MSDGWSVELDGIVFSGGDDPPDPHGCLNENPEGLGLPPIRTEDVTHPQRDGVEHFSDWYGPRIVTIPEVTVCADNTCDNCPGAHGKVREIVAAWSRRCDDAELVIRTDCDGQGPAEEVGPFGAIGRPRVATVEWPSGRHGCAEMTLRFDAVDHRLYVLDPATGAPGSGGDCVTLDPDVDIQARCYPRCYDDGPSNDAMCYDTVIFEVDQSVQSVDVAGTECACPTITMFGPSTDPRVANLTTGEEVRFNGTLGPGQVVVIDGAEGTATIDGVTSAAHLVTGDLPFCLPPGLNTLRMTAFSGGGPSPDSFALFDGSSTGRIESTNRPDDDSDLDVRWFGAADDWDSGAMWLAGQAFVESTNSWIFALGGPGGSDDGHPTLWLSDGGGTIESFVCDTPVGFVDGVLNGLRVTWRDSDGLITWFTADDPDDPEGTTWTQLGSTDTNVMVNDLGTVPGDLLTVGAGPDGQSPYDGEMTYVEVLQQIGSFASRTSGADFRVQEDGADMFIGLEGQEWTVLGSTVIVDPTPNLAGSAQVCWRPAVVVA